MSRTWATRASPGRSPCTAAIRVPAPGVAHVRRAARAQVAASLPEGKHAAGPLWFSLFKYMDEDGSGRISFGELERGIREQLRLDRADLSDMMLRELWKAPQAGGPMGK